MDLGMLTIRRQEEFYYNQVLLYENNCETVEYFLITKALLKKNYKQIV